MSSGQCVMSRLPSGGGTGRLQQPSPTSGNGDWKALAEKDPPNMPRLDQERQKEQTLLADANDASRRIPGPPPNAPWQALGLPGRPKCQARAQPARSISAAGEGAENYDELGKFLVRQGHPGRPYRPDP